MIENFLMMDRFPNSLLCYFINIITNLIGGLSNGTRFGKKSLRHLLKFNISEHCFLDSQEYLQEE